MNPIEHVQFVNVCRCAHPDCHGDERGCRTGGINLSPEELRAIACKGMPKWERWSHDRFVQTLERCPHGCRQKQGSAAAQMTQSRENLGGALRSAIEKDKSRLRPQIVDDSLHLCHARGCGKPVPPRLLMCLRHWRMVPIDIQRRVWKHYRPGQELDKKPTAEYLEVMKEAILAVAEREGL